MTTTASTPASTRLFAALVGLALAASVVAGCDSDGGTTATAPPDATGTASTAAETTAETTAGTSAPTTTFDNPFSDEEIATRILLDADEYGPGWQVFDYKRVVLDRDLAASIPGCAAYLDTVFESAARPSVTAWRFFHAPPGRPAAMSQYVVVFPTEAAAEAMFAATNEPAFRTDCAPEYRRAAADPTGYCCNPEVPFPAALSGDPVPTEKTLGANDLALRSEQQDWIDAEGTTHGPETILSATVRVGRAITVIETIGVDEFGVPFVGEDQFDHAIATVSQRSLHALGGVNH